KFRRHDSNPVSTKGRLSTNKPRNESADRGFARIIKPGRVRPAFRQEPWLPRAAERELLNTAIGPRIRRISLFIAAMSRDSYSCQETGAPGPRTHPSLFRFNWREP